MSGYFEDQMIHSFYLANTKISILCFVCTTKLFLFMFLFTCYRVDWMEKWSNHESNEKKKKTKHLKSTKKEKIKAKLFWRFFFFFLSEQKTFKWFNFSCIFRRLVQCCVCSCSLRLYFHIAFFIIVLFALWFSLPDVRQIAFRCC